MVDAEPVKSQSLVEIPELFDDIVAWYRNHGYTPPTPGDMARGAVLAPSDATSKKDAIGPSSKGGTEYETILGDRNVEVEPTEDEADSLLQDIKREVMCWDRTALGDDDPYIPDSTPEELDKWNQDMRKCHQENESVFQRTLMMEMFQRHSLGDKLDYISDSEWASQSPPRKPASINRRMGNPSLT